MNHQKGMSSRQYQTRGQKGLVLSQGGTTPETGERHSQKAVSRQNNSIKDPVQGRAVPSDKILTSIKHKIETGPRQWP